MAKKVAIEQKIELGGHDISNHVTSWAIDSTVGQLIVAEVDIIYRNGKHDSPLSFESATPPNMVVKINDTDISSHVYGYRFEERDVIRLYLQADKNVLRINSTAPWEYPDGAAA